MNRDAKLPEIRVGVVEAGGRARKGWVPCEIDKNLNSPLISMLPGSPKFMMRSCWQRQ
jgi:hypothetical protein